MSILSRTFTCRVVPNSLGGEDKDHHVVAPCVAGMMGSSLQFGILARCFDCEGLERGFSPIRGQTAPLAAGEIRLNCRNTMVDDDGFMISTVIVPTTFFLRMRKVKIRERKSLPLMTRGLGGNSAGSHLLGIIKE